MMENTNTQTQVDLPPCWIFANQRNGSVYLERLLIQNYRCNPPINEWLHPDFRIIKIRPALKRVLITGGIEKGVRFVRTRLPKYNKIHPYQYNFFGLDFNNIPKRLPGVKFIHIKRDDIIATAVSLYIAEYTGAWLLQTEEQTKRFNESPEIPYIHDRMADAYERVVKHHNFWDEYLKDRPHFLIEYEAMIQNPQDTFERISRFLGIRNIVEPKLPVVRKQSRPESDRFVFYLKKWIKHGTSVGYTKIL